jgi:hypothetical protein
VSGHELRRPWDPPYQPSDPGTSSLTKLLAKWLRSGTATAVVYLHVASVSIEDGGLLHVYHVALVTIACCLFKLTVNCRNMNALHWLPQFHFPAWKDVGGYRTCYSSTQSKFRLDRASIGQSRGVQSLTSLTSARIDLLRCRGAKCR